MGILGLDLGTLRKRSRRGWCGRKMDVIASPGGNGFQRPRRPEVAGCIPLAWRGTSTIAGSVLNVGQREAGGWLGQVGIDGVHVDGRAFAAGRWNFPSNGKVFIDTKHGPTTTTNKLKTRKLGMVEKGGDEGGDSRRSLSMQQRKMPGFVAYTLDYHPPKHHPPKNN
nr:root meristem growth factor 2 [Ipomoea batatas]